MATDRGSWSRISAGLALAGALSLLVSAATIFGFPIDGRVPWMLAGGLALVGSGFAAVAWRREGRETAIGAMRANLVVATACLALLVLAVI